MSIRIRQWALPLAMPVALMSLSGCLADWDGEGGDDVIGGPDTYEVGGNVTGLDADPVVLSLNNNQQLSVGQDGAFVFNNGVPDGASYDVTVSEHPGDNRVCDVSNGSGTIAGADVSNVTVSCEVLTVGAVTEQKAVTLDWNRSGMVDIAYSTDHQCDWTNVSTCDNGGRAADVSGGSLTLDVDGDGLQMDGTYSFVLQQHGQTSAPVVATPASFHLNDTVRDTVIAGSHVFAGGDFTHYAADTGGLAVVRADLAEGAQTGTVPGVRGAVFDMVEAPGGGWYIAGVFDRVHGELREGVARLNPDGSLDTGWSVSVNGGVFDLHATADRLYIAGDFADVEGNSGYSNLAALTHAGDLDTAFDPETPSDPAHVVVEHDGLVYVGGEFQGMGTAAQDHLVALDPTDGSIDTGFTPQVNNAVVDVATIDGDRLAIAGVFGEVGGEVRAKVAAIDQADGSVDTGFDADIGSSLLVWRLQPTADGLLLGGWFDTVGGESRPGIARVDVTDGSLDTAWDPALNAGIGMGFAVEGDTIYVAGSFEDSGGDVSHLRRLNASDGSLDPDWNPGLDAQATTVTLADTGVWVGGEFNSIQGIAVDYFAAFDLQNGTLDEDWDPAFDAPVHALTTGDGGLFIGGEFSEVTTASGSTQPHAYATGLHLSDGSGRGWQPQPENDVYALEMRDDENAVYIGGLFGLVKGQNFQRMAVVDTLKGDPLGSANDPGVAGTVNDLAHRPGGLGVLLGGAFSEVDGFTYENTTFLDEDDLSLRNFTPDPDGTVWAVDGHQFGNESRNFLGGEFLNVAGQAHEHFAIVDGNSGLVTNYEFDGPVRAIDFRADNQSLLVGGDFETVLDSGSSAGERHNFAALVYDGSSMSLRAEQSDFDGRVLAIDQTADHIAVGGEFNAAASQHHGRLVVLDATTLEPEWTGSAALSAANGVTHKRGFASPEQESRSDEAPWKRLVNGEK